MSTAEFFDWERTDPVGIKPVRPEVHVAIGAHGSMSLREAVAAKFGPIGRAARRTASATSTGAQWVRYGWQVTAAPRAGYGAYRHNRNRYINNTSLQARVDRLEVKADKIEKTKHSDKILAEAADLEAKIARQRPIRLFVGYMPTLATLSGGLYAHTTLPVWEQGGLALLASAGAVGAATVRGRMIEDLPEAKRPQPKGALNDTRIMSALRKLGIPELAKAIDEDPESIYISPVIELADRSGWTCIISLAEGVKRSKVMGARELLAQNLGAKHLSCLTMVEGDSTTDIVLTLTKEPAGQRKAPPSSLVNTPSVDLTEPIAIGHDPAGNDATMTFAQTILIAGTSGSGKSTVVKVIFGNTILDPTSERILWNGKGGGDYAELAPALHYYANGHVLKGKRAEMMEHARRIIDYLNSEDARRPEILERKGVKAVTPELAQSVPGLHPIVCIFDEAQYLDPELVEALTALKYQVRSTNIKLVVAIQGLVGNIPYRFPEHWKRKMVLQLGDNSEVTKLAGNKATVMGFDATDPDHTPGAAIIVGEPGGLQRVQIAELTEDQQRAIVARGGVVDKLDLTPKESQTSQTFGIEPDISADKTTDISNANSTNLQVDADSQVDTTEDTTHRSHNLIADIWQQRREGELGVNVETLCQRLALFDGAWRDINPKKLRKLMSETYEVTPKPIAGGFRGYHWIDQIEPLL